MSKKDKPTYPAREPTRFDVFVSYNSDDRDEVAKLVSALDAHVRVWFDQRELKPGDHCCRTVGAVHEAYSEDGALVLVVYTPAEVKRGNE